MKYPILTRIPIRISWLFVAAFSASVFLTLPLSRAGTTPDNWQKYFGGVQGSSTLFTGEYDWVTTLREANDKLAFPIGTGEFNDLQAVSGSNPLNLNTIDYFNKVITGHDWIYGQNIGWHNRSECDIANFCNTRIANRNTMGRQFSEDIYKQQVYLKCKAFVIQRAYLRNVDHVANLGKIYWQLGNEITDSRGPAGQVYWLSTVRSSLCTPGNYPYPGFINNATTGLPTTSTYGDAYTQPADSTIRNWNNAALSNLGNTGGLKCDASNWSQLKTADADTGFIPYIVEYYMVPTIEAIRRVNKEIDDAISSDPSSPFAGLNVATTDKISILLGSISGSSNDHNRAVYLSALLNYTTLANNATLAANKAVSFSTASPTADPYQVCGKKLKTLVDGFTYHYAMGAELYEIPDRDAKEGGYAWTEAYVTDIYSQATGTLKVWATEELGDKRWQAGEGASHSLRVLARYLDTWTSMTTVPSSSKARVILFGWLGQARANWVGNQSVYQPHHPPGLSWYREDYLLDSDSGGVPSSTAFGVCPKLSTLFPPEYTPGSDQTIAADALQDISDFTGQAALTRLNTYPINSTNLNLTAPAVTQGQFANPIVVSPTKVANIESYSFKVEPTATNKRVVIITPQYADSKQYNSSGTVSAGSPNTISCPAVISNIYLQKGGWTVNGLSITAVVYGNQGLETYYYNVADHLNTIQLSNLGGYGTGFLSTTPGFLLTFSSTSAPYTPVNIDLNNIKSPVPVPDAEFNLRLVGQAQRTIVLYCTHN